MKLTLIAGKRRLVRQISADDIPEIAATLRELRPEIERISLTIFVEDDDGITHLICRRDRLAQPDAGSSSA